MLPSNPYVEVLQARNFSVVPTFGVNILVVLKKGIYNLLLKIQPPKGITDGAKDASVGISCVKICLMVSIRPDASKK